MSRNNDGLTLGQLGEINAGLHVEVARLNEQVQALAAEASYLRSEIVQHSESTHQCEKCGEADPCATDDVCWALNHPIPATDAILNEVRAQGAEEAIDKAIDAMVRSGAQTFGDCVVAVNSIRKGEQP